MLKKKTDLHVPQDSDSDIAKSRITEKRRPFPHPSHTLKVSPVLQALLVFCEGSALSERLRGPRWERISAGSTIAMLSLLFLQMKPRNFVPG